MLHGSAGRKCVETIGVIAIVFVGCSQDTGDSTGRAQLETSSRETRDSSKQISGAEHTLDPESAIAALERQGATVKRRADGTAESVVFKSQTTDVDLSPIAVLETLKSLIVRYTDVDDDDLRHLSRMGKLELLWLNETPVSDQGLGHLAGLQNLRWLVLDDTSVTDAGMKHLAKLSNLRQLGLQRTKVTDAAVQNLKALTKLHRIELVGTAVTDVGAAELHTALPNVSIAR